MFWAWLQWKKMRLARFLSLFKFLCHLINNFNNFDLLDHWFHVKIISKSNSSTFLLSDSKMNLSVIKVNPYNFLYFLKTSLKKTQISSKKG
jgi:hypothetical protein